jgi:hypothetical protein
MSANAKGRPRKGQHVSFTRTVGRAPAPRADAVTGLRFTVDTAHGGPALIDIVALRPRRLALAFGSALRELAPTMVRSTVIQHVNGLKRFFQFLNETAATVDGPERLRANHIDGFESWLEARGVRSVQRRAILAKAVIALRTIDASRPGQLDEKLRQRLRYTSARPSSRSTPRDAYSGYVAKQLRDAARADIRTSAHRLKSPSPIEHSDAALCKHLQAAATLIETEGVVGYKHPILRAFRDRFHLLGLKAGTPIRDLHARRYLLAEDVVPFLVLLSLETGLEPECIKALRHDCLRNPASGTVEIEYCKRRAPGSEWKRLRVRDGALSMPGGIIRTLIELTATARKHKPSESLWFYFHAGRLDDRIRQFPQLIRNWVASQRIVGASSAATQSSLRASCRPSSPSWISLSRAAPTWPRPTGGPRSVVPGRESRNRYCRRSPRPSSRMPGRGRSGSSIGLICRWRHEHEAGRITEAHSGGTPASA